MRGWMVALAAASLLTLVPAKAEAGFCGVARYSCCAPCCQMQCHTVMKTVRCVEYEQQECHMLQDVLGPGVRRSGDQLRQVRPRDPHEEKSATRSASRCWETKTRCYTVCKPVLGNQARKEICYTVCKPVLGNQDPLLHGVQAGLGNQDRRLLHGVQAGLGNQDPLLHGLQAGLGNQDPHATRCASRCWETRTEGDLLHGVQAGAGKPAPAATRCASRCWEDPTRVKICYHVRMPVHYTKTIQVPSGHWETETY